MWARLFRLLGIVLAAMFLGYLIGCTQPEAASPPQSGSGFLVTNLSVKPLEVEPNEVVTITVSVANTHDTWGIYSLVLKINGVEEAEKQATVDAGSSQDVSFSLTKENPGSYSVFSNGLRGGFTVVAPAPAPAPEPTPTPEPGFNWFLIGGIIAGVVIAGLLIYFLVFRRRAYLEWLRKAK